MAPTIQPRQQQVLRGDQFHFALLDAPLLLTQFDRAAHRFGVNFAPIEQHVGIGRLVGGANQPAIGGGQAHHITQAVFGSVNIRQPGFQRRSEQEVLFARLSFAIGFATFGSDDELGVHFFPSLQGGIAAAFVCFQVAVGEIKFPIGVFHVGHEVPHAGFEIGQANIGANAGNHHAVVLQIRADAAQRIERAGDAVVSAAGPLQQRLPEADFKILGPGAGCLLRGIVVGVVRGVFGCGDFGPRRRCLGDPGLERAQILLEHAAGNIRGKRADVLRLIVLIPHHIREQIRIECRERSFDAENRIAFHQCRFVHRNGIGRRRSQTFWHRRNVRAGDILQAGNAHAQRAHYFAVFQSDFHRIGQAQIPRLVELRIAHRQRRHRIVHFLQAARLHIGILDVRGNSHVVRQIAVFEEVKRLRGRTTRRQRRGQQQ